MKPIIFLLLVLLVLLQYQLWFAPNGMLSVVQFEHEIMQMLQKNQIIEKRNALLKVEIQDLKQGNAAIEESARNDLGMIKEGEVFYQIVPKTTPK